MNRPAHVWLAAVPYVLVVALGLTLVSNNLFTTGMHSDGLVYSSIAANMAEGNCTLWHPMFTQTYMSNFNGHPPLMMWMLAVWMRLFGTSMLAAKLYSLAVMAGTWALVVGIWRRLGFEVRQGWLPLLLTLLIPSMIYSTHSNYLESTMALFVLASVWMALGGRWWHLGAGAMLALAALVKGPTGLYPLALPLLVWATGVRREGFGKMLCHTALMVVGLAVPLALLMLWGEAREYLFEYVRQQSQSATGFAGGSRLRVLVVLAEQLAILVAVVAVAMLVAHLCKFAHPWRPASQHWRTAAMLLLLALCGSLPMMVTTKQFPHYLMAVYPVAALAAGALLEPLVRHFDRPLHSTVALLLAVAMACVAVGVNIGKWGQPGRDKVLQADMQLMAEVWQRGEVVSVAHDVAADYPLQGYCYFFHRVSLDPDHPHKHLIATAESNLNDWPGAWHPVGKAGAKYWLYEQTADPVQHTAEK